MNKKVDGFKIFAIAIMVMSSIIAILNLIDIFG